MIAPSGKHEQGLGHGIHRVIEHHGAQLFSQRCSARLTRYRDDPALRAKGLRQGVDVRGLPGTVDAFETDE